MENYTLSTNETILYRGKATMLHDGKTGKKETKNVDLLLTNLNIVIFEETKKLFKTVSETTTYSVSDVKIYDETVQIIRRKSVVDIYLNCGELFLDFEKEKEAKLFCDQALKLVSGNSKLVRSVKKARKAIKETNEALDIDVIDIAKKTAAIACTATVNVASLEDAGKKTKIFGKIAETFLPASKKKQSQEMLSAPSDEAEAIETNEV